MKTILKNDRISTLAFIIIFCTFLFQSGVFDLVNKAPFGIHYIRQTEALSFIQRYFQDNLSFWTPATFNLQSNDGKCVSEFPVLYWICAKYYFLFGENEQLLRYISLSLHIASAMFMFLVLKMLLNQNIISGIFTLLFFSSPTIAYYGANYLPDSPALSLNIAAWYFFLRNYKNRKSKFLLFSMFLFSLGALLKITTAIHLVTATLIYFYDKNNFKWQSFLYFGLSYLTIIGWNIYVRYYNQVNESNAFLISTKPIWDLNFEEIKEVFVQIKERWWWRYYNLRAWTLWALFSGGLIFIFKRGSLKITVPYLILFGGGIAYILLFFPQFTDHDYYFITFAPPFAAMALAGLLLWIRNFSALFSKWYIQVFLCVGVYFVCSNAAFALKENVNKDTDPYFQEAILFAENKFIIDSVLKTEDRIIIAAQYNSPNGILYQLNRKGFSIEKLNEISEGRFRKYMELGGNVLIFKRDELPNAVYSKYFRNILFENKEIIITDLKIP